MKTDLENFDIWTDGLTLWIEWKRNGVITTVRAAILEKSVRKPQA